MLHPELVLTFRSIRSVSFQHQLIKSNSFRCLHHAKLLKANQESNNSILSKVTAAIKQPKSDRLTQPATNKSNGTFRFNQSIGNSSQRYGGRDENFARKKKTIIKWTTGTYKAKEAASHIHEKVLENNEAGLIDFLDTDTGKMTTTTIYNFARGMDLDKEGLVLLNVRKTDDGTSIPLIKKVESRVALQNYSDKLAQVKDAELKKKGIKIRGRPSTDKADDNVKTIRISWKINIDDLTHQKSQEIIGALKKGNKVFLYIDDKGRTTSATWIDSFESSRISHELKISSRDRKEREQVMEHLKTLIEENCSNSSLDGNITTKIVYTLLPKKLERNGKAQITEKTALKEQRRQKRQEKLRLRTERKQNKL